MTTPESVTTQGSQPLRPKARLIRAIGDQLISNEVVALLELVKNSYDADATCVIVKFVPNTDFKGGRVLVIDNGTGMSLETMRGAWMEPATDYKIDRPRSRTGRRVLGEKGLGRFAAARIADHFYVTSRIEGSDQEARVLLDWTAFDVKDRYLDEVLVLWDVTQPKDITPNSEFEEQLVRAGLLTPGTYTHGTVLSLEVLRRAWDEDDFRSLQRALSRLVSPFQADIPGGYTIQLEAPDGFEEFTGKVGPPSVFQHPHYSLEGTVAADGSCDLTLATPAGVASVQKKFVLKRERIPTCGAFELKLRVWDRDPESLRGLASQMGGGSVDEIRRDINAIGGVNLYRDHFRILPYGEYGNDWIGLDSRRVQNPTLRLSNNQVSGYIFITAEDNPGLVDQSNREGLFENQAAKDLRELLTHTISELENARYDTRPRRDGPNQRSAGADPRGEGLFKGFSLDPLRKAAEDLHPTDDKLRKAIDDTQRGIDESVERVKKVLSRYQRLATLGQLVDLVLHEGRQPVARIRYDVEDMRSLLRRTPPEALQLIVPKLLDELEAVDKNADLLSAIFKRMDPFSGRQRGRPRNVVLEDEIRAGVALVHEDVEAVGAEVTTPTSHTTVNVDPADIQMIVKNLVQNSAYWLSQVPRDARRIMIEVQKPSPGVVEISVSDSGPGVPEGDRTEIWRPYFTRKPDGVGLGLAIVGDIVQDFYGGNLDLTDGPLPGATFTVTLRRRVG
jgi:signal transduction histidine kinase